MSQRHQGHQGQPGQPGQPGHSGDDADEKLKRRSSPHEDDILSDSSIEDLDLASLIGDSSIAGDSHLLASGSQGSATTGSRGSAEPEPHQLIDDGELDLGADEPEEIRADDLLDNDLDLLASEPARDEVEEPIVLVSEDEAEDLEGSLSGVEGALGAASRIANQTRGSKAPSARGSTKDRIQDTVSLDGEPSRVEGQSSSGVSRSQASRSGEGDSGVDKKDTDKNNKAEKGAGKSGKSWKRLGKAGKKGETPPDEPSAEASGGETSESPVGAEDSKPSRKEKGKKAKIKPSKSKSRGADQAEAARPAAFSASGRGSVAFVCSECYEEFLLPANYSQEMVCCPECLHVGKRPDADFLRTVNRHKAGEQKSLAMAIASGALVVGLVLYLLWLSSDMHVAQHGAPDKNLVLGLLGGSGLLTAIFLWLSVKSESNRWEVYF